MTVWRSLLFVAANDAARLDKIATRGADAIILDLEDAVAPADKAAARVGLSAIIDRLPPFSPLVVRINTGWLDALDSAPLDYCRQQLIRADAVTA